MQDSPPGAALLQDVMAALRAGIWSDFQQRVAANAIGLALREAELAPASDRAEHVRLSALLGDDGSLVELNEALCAAIRAGAFGSDDAGLLAHLRLTAEEKLRVDQPTYPAFKQSLEQE